MEPTLTPIPLSTAIVTPGKHKYHHLQNMLMTLGQLQSLLRSAGNLFTTHSSGEMGDVYFGHNPTLTKIGEYEPTLEWMARNARSSC